MFGDEPGRSYSPNELDSLRNVYQNNVTAHSDDERDVRESKEADDDLGEEEIPDDENLNQDFGTGEDYGNEESENIKDDNFRNYNATAKSEDDVVVGDAASWDPNDTRMLPKEGNRDNVIIEISNFSLKENSQVMMRDDVQQLFVGMEFLNYDPVDLESKNSMPKPAANQAVHFNFRKSDKTFHFILSLFGVGFKMNKNNFFFKFFLLMPNVI